MNRGQMVRDRAGSGYERPIEDEQRRFLAACLTDRMRQAAPEAALSTLYDTLRTCAARVKGNVRLAPKA